MAIMAKGLRQMAAGFKQQMNARKQFVDSIISHYSAARRNPESRFATRALGDVSDLGITDSLTLGAAPPAPSSTTVRPLNILLDDYTSRFDRRWIK